MYFDGSFTPSTLRQAYWNLAMAWHPDRPGGDLRTMQAINAEYEQAMKRLDGHKFQTAQEEEYTYNYRADYEQEVIDIVQALASQRFPAGVLFELLGSWVWCSGTRREDKSTQERLKGMSFLWHGTRRLWYWKPTGSFSRFKAGVSFDDLRNHYSARTIPTAKDEQVWVPALSR